MPLQLDVRIRRGWGLPRCDVYRGFFPHSKLVLTHKWQTFEMATKRRVLDSGPKEYRVCDALQQTMSRLYRQAGVKLGSSHSEPRTLAARVLAATGDVETVQAVLGHQELDHTRQYLTVDQSTIRSAFELAL
jgi:site-specific recombinase XerC